MPPILKIDDPVLASTMGATLATRRSTAEKLDAHVDPNDLLLNRMQIHSVRIHWLLIMKLQKNCLSECGVECYIMNTGFFLEKKVPKEVTL